MITSLIPSFNAGELSPLIHLRSDLEKYRSGCRTLENMLITPYGGVRRRPGLEYIAGTKEDGPARVVRFQYSIDDSFILEFGDLYMRVFKNGSPIMDGPDPYEIASPYAVAHLFDFQIIQVNNIARIVHPLFPPHHLVRIADDNWSLSPLEFTYPPLLDENLIESHTMEVSFTTAGPGPYTAWATATVYAVGARVTRSSADYVCIRAHTSTTPNGPPNGTYWAKAFTDSSTVNGQIVDLISSEPFFTAGHIGAFMEISKERLLTEYEVELIASSANSGLTSPSIIIQGRWSFNTFGLWRGMFYIERSRDRGATWEDIRYYEADGDRNVSDEGEEPFRVLMRIRWIRTGDGSNGPRAILASIDAFIRGIVRITEVTDELNAKAEGVTPTESCITFNWAEGAWSTFRGFPRALTAHEQRIVYGGTSSRSQTLWGSSIDDYDNFKRGTNDDDSWAHSLAADQQNSIQWLLSQKQLLVGTSGGEWVMASSKEETPITPTNVRARRHSGHGSEYIPATLVNDVALFIQRGSRKLREMSFSYEQDGYVTSDLTMLAEHISEGGIIQTAYQAQRDSILWCVTGAGNLIGMTYERGQSVIGWHRHVTGDPATDGFESVAVLEAPGEEDEVWVVVRRGARRFIERFRPDQFRAQSDNDLNGLFFVDSGLTVSGEELTEINLPHLEGETVQVLADGAVLPSRVVTGGVISLNEPGDPESASVISAGLAYNSILEPMALEIGMQNGTSVSREKRIHELVIYFHQTSGCRVSPNLSGPFDTIPFRTADMVPGDPPSLFSGPLLHKLDSRHELEASFVIKQDLPLPMTILAVVPKFQIYGDNI